MRHYCFLLSYVIFISISNLQQVQTSKFLQNGSNSIKTFLHRLQWSIFVQDIKNYQIFVN